MIYAYLSAIFIFMALSAFFSLSEAAFFSLNQKDRQRLSEGGHLGRMALRLTAHSEELLSSILLGNLVVNLLTFTLSTIIAFQFQKQGRTDLAGLVAFMALFGVILLCEILPKSLGVAAPRVFVLLCVLPISFVVQGLRPVLPILQSINILSRRLFCPNFVSESYLRVGDLERAVEMSQQDATLLKREQRVLQNIVSLSDIRAEELMRPRSLLKVFRPTSSFDEILHSLHGKLPRSGYCLLTEPNSDEIATALSFTRLTPTALEHNEEHFETVLFIPWSAPVADAFNRIHGAQTDVAVVVNEFGESIGILTMDDIIETIFTREQGRSRRLSDRMELKRLDTHLWQVNELTSLRRLKRKFNLSFTDYSSLTVGGLLREVLERFPKTGDRCVIGTLEFHVVEATEENGLIVQVRLLSESHV